MGGRLIGPGHHEFVQAKIQQRHARRHDSISAKRCCTPGSEEWGLNSDTTQLEADKTTVEERMSAGGDDPAPVPKKVKHGSWAAAAIVFYNITLPSPQTPRRAE
eukprot:SAG22_NODE_731_length_7588_cov_6.237281_9_plen_104_part_00